MVHYISKFLTPQQDLIHLVFRPYCCLPWSYFLCLKQAFKSLNCLEIQMSELLEGLTNRKFQLIEIEMELLFQGDLVDW